MNNDYKLGLPSSINSQHYKLIAEAAREGIALHKDGIITSVNQSLADLFGYTLSEMDGMDIYSLIIPAAHDIFEKKLYSEKDISFETYGRSKDGKNILVEVFIVNFKNEENLQSVVFRDITKRKTVETALLRTEREYKSLFEEVKDGIYISSRDGHILDANKALLDLFGYTKDEILNLDIHKIYKDPRDRYRFQLEVETKGSVGDYEVQLLKKDGTVMDCLLSSTIRLSKDKEVIGYQGIIRDITHLKRANELKKEKELAEQSAMMKEQFLANMSHEIRTPLNAVFGMTNLLLESEQEPQQRKYLETIKSSTDHLLILINDILDYSKIEAGKIDINEAEFSLEDLVDNLYSTLKYKVENRKLDFSYELDPTLPQYVVGDAVRLNQILLNLLSNAIKFTYKGYIKLKVRLLQENKTMATIIFSVVDTGIGISESKLNKIFDSFTQVSQDTTREFGGTGLGLAITKKLVELMDGSIVVKSKEKEGSTFSFTLKLKKGHKTEKDHKQIEIPKLKDLGELRILLAEDNTVNQFVIQETIKKWGKKITVDIADNGEIAVKKFENRNYDLVIMDVQMPIMDGYEATRYIRTKFSAPKNQTPILALTAFATIGEADKCLSIGMDDYISKPFEYLKLYEKIAMLTSTDLEHQPVIENEVKNEINIKKDIATEAPSLTASEATPIINLNYLDQITQGDQVLRREMINVILSETPGEVLKMRELFKRNDLQTLNAIAHRFKSTGTYIGNKELEFKIKELERLSKAGEATEIDNLLKYIENVCERACQELQKVIKN